MIKTQENNFLSGSQSDAKHGQKQSSKVIPKIEDKNTHDKKQSIQSQAIVKMQEESPQYRIQLHGKSGQQQQKLDLIKIEASVKTEDDQFFEKKQFNVMPNWAKQEEVIVKIQDQRSIERTDLTEGSAIIKMEEDSSSERSFLDGKFGKNQQQPIVKVEEDNSFEERQVSSNNVRKVKKHRIKWKLEEHLRYLSFIQDPLRQIELKAKKNIYKQKIFNLMSAKIQTRNPRQCKSHHHKMIAKYSNIKRILTKLPDDLKSMKQVDKMTNSNTLIT